jgi:exodeoxyribonuclease V
VATADLTVIDEGSMVGGEVANDLLSFGTPTLIFTDQAQLPPVGDAGYFIRRTSDFQLTEVHRQALNSPVIELATRVRNGLPLRLGDYGGGSAVVDGISIEEMLGFDQVIIGTHRTRHSLNRKIRRELGFGGSIPERGEKVLCLKNNRAKGLLNGSLWTVLEATRFKDGFIEMEIENEDGCKVEVVVPREGFSADGGGGYELPGQPFAFGYAITCHKAQGSEWDSVVVIDESRWFREHRDRWLYTAITRASERVVVIK